MTWGSHWASVSDELKKGGFSLSDGTREKKSGGRVPPFCRRKSSLRAISSERREEMSLTARAALSSKTWIRPEKIKGKEKHRESEIERE